MSAGRLALMTAAGLVALSLGAPLWTALLGVDPSALVAGPSEGPSPSHWLGTDEVGRDVLARLMYGARTSLLVAVAAALVAGVVGGTLGAAAGLWGGWVDEVVVRATEATMTVPKLPLLILLSTLAPPAGQAGRLVFLVVLLAFMAWPGPARLARASAMTTQAAGYVEASRGLGATPMWILRRHILPRTVPVVAVSAASDVAELLLLESLLSYLGFGIPEPAPSLGNLLAQGLPSLFESPAGLIAPGLVTVAAVTTLHVVADRWAVHIDPHRSSPERRGADTVRDRNE